MARMLVFFVAFGILGCRTSSKTGEGSEIKTYFGTCTATVTPLHFGAGGNSYDFTGRSLDEAIAKCQEKFSYSACTEAVECKGIDYCKITATTVDLSGTQKHPFVGNDLNQALTRCTTKFSQDSCAENVQCVGHKVCRTVVSSVDLSGTKKYFFVGNTTDEVMRTCRAKFSESACRTNLDCTSK